jgi:hypothetical protein
MTHAGVDGRAVDVSTLPPCSQCLRPSVNVAVVTLPYEPSLSRALTTEIGSQTVTLLTYVCEWKSHVQCTSAISI